MSHGVLHGSERRFEAIILGRHLSSTFRNFLRLAVTS